MHPYWVFGPIEQRHMALRYFFHLLWLDSLVINQFTCPSLLLFYERLKREVFIPVISLVLSSPTA